MPRLLSRAVVWIAAVLLALCAGAVWSVLALILGDPSQWFAIAAGLVAIWAVDWVSAPRAIVRATFAAALVFLAAGYAYYLYAASVVSIKLGIPFADTVRVIGVEMAYALSVARAPLLQGFLIGASALGAAVVSWFRVPPHLRASPPPAAR